MDHPPARAVTRSRTPTQDNDDSRQAMADPGPDLLAILRMLEPLDVEDAFPDDVDTALLPLQNEKQDERPVAP